MDEGSRQLSRKFGQTNGQMLVLDCWAVAACEEPVPCRREAMIVEAAQIPDAGRQSPVDMKCVAVTKWCWKTPGVDEMKVGTVRGMQREGGWYAQR
jgi:hypothetical protein